MKVIGRVSLLHFANVKMVRKKGKKKSERPDDLQLSHVEYETNISEKKERLQQLLDKLDKETLLKKDLDQKLGQLTEEKVEIEQLLTRQIIQKEEFIDSMTDEFEVGSTRFAFPAWGTTHFFD